MESRRASERDHGQMDLGPPVILFLREGGLHLRHRGIERIDLAVRGHAAAHVRHQDDGQGTCRRDGEFFQAGHFLPPLPTFRASNRQGLRLDPM